MAKLNTKQLHAIWKQGEEGRTFLGNGLIFRVSASGTATFEVRYSIYGRRRIMGLLPAFPALSLAEAEHQAAQIRYQAKQGLDPQETKKQVKQKPFKLLRDLAKHWLDDIDDRIKTGHIYRRVYNNDIDPQLGGLPPDKIRPIDINNLLKKIRASGRPAIANDALHYIKRIFQHGMKLGEVTNNPAEPFRYEDAGGTEKPRDRALTFKELDILFSTMRKYKDQITRENYLAVALLVCLGCRKMELMAATWDEIDFNEREWLMPSNRSKTGKAIRVPLVDPVYDWLQELHVRAAGSDYVFPSRRASKRPHVSPDTLNAALAKLLREEKLALEPFTIHDLRRTTKTLLASMGVPPHVSERCLNHKIRGVEGVYDHYDYFNERKTAYEKLSGVIAPMVNQ